MKHIYTFESFLVEKHPSDQAIVNAVVRHIKKGGEKKFKISDAHQISYMMGYDILSDDQVELLIKTAKKEGITINEE